VDRGLPLIVKDYYDELSKVKRGAINEAVPEVGWQ
jgi:hypothetical protein